ncbi:MAG TPA: cysteine desulfurase family protein [Candidatus Limnocylindrales bacterium]|nr:cysteine desulfurase family protein [Candidatus Limnocylindrales bacterium]
MNSRSDTDELVYLDFNATTPVDPAVLEAMLPYFVQVPGNPSSTHAWGRRAVAAVDRARGEIADAIGAGVGNVIFTSGATESDNLAVLGSWAANASPSRRRVITVATEHKAVLEPVAALREAGADVVILDVDLAGRFDLDGLSDALRVPTVLVSVMAANNETGLLAPLRQVVDATHDAGALAHTDAAQILGKAPFDVRDLELDLVSLSAHKVYGPKGVGALYVAPGTAVAPRVHGGGHERNLRSGTLNVPGIVGFGAAASLAAVRRERDMERIADLRDSLLEQLSRAIPGIRRNGAKSGVLANTLNVRVPGVDAEDLLLASPRLGASTGSACTAGSPEPSHVLTAMSLSHEEARSSIRFSLGRTTKASEIPLAVAAIVEGYERLGRMK